MLSPTDRTVGSRQFSQSLDVAASHIKLVRVLQITLQQVLSAQGKRS